MELLKYSLILRKMMQGFCGIILLASIASCAVSKSSLQQTIYSSVSSLGHVDNAKRNFKDRQDTIHISTSMKKNAINRFSLVTEESVKIIPLLIYNQWKLNYDISLGSNQIKENPSDYVKQRLARDINYSTKFLADTSSLISNKNQLRLTISIDSLEVKGSYKVDGFFLFMIFYVMTENHYPSGEAISQLTYTLHEGETILLQRTVKSQKSINVIGGEYASFKVFRQTYVNHLIEALSESLKTSVKKIVHEVNTEMKLMSD